MIPAIVTLVVGLAIVMISFFIGDGKKEDETDGTLAESREKIEKQLEDIVTVLREESLHYASPPHRITTIITGLLRKKQRKTKNLLFFHRKLTPAKGGSDGKPLRRTAERNAGMRAGICCL